MTWTRLSDDFNDRPDNARLGRSARLLHVEALVWCNKVLTDGALPDYMVRRITDSDDLEGDVAQLAEVGKWTRLESDDGWQVDWSGQERADVVEQRREDNAARQRLFNERRRRHNHDDHSICHPMGCEALRRNALRNASGDASLTDPRPVPSRPDPKGGTGTGDRDSGSAHGGRRSANAPRAASATPPDEDEQHGRPAYPGGLPPGVIPGINGVAITELRPEEFT